MFFVWPNTDLTCCPPSLSAVDDVVNRFAQERVAGRAVLVRRAANGRAGPARACGHCRRRSDNHRPQRRRQCRRWWSSCRTFRRHGLPDPLICPLDDVPMLTVDPPLPPGFSKRRLCHPLLHNDGDELRMYSRRTRRQSWVNHLQHAFDVSA